MKPTKNRIFCNECQRPKMLFETEKKALLFMKFNNEEIAEENEKVPSRAYFCEACAGWHLTHFIDPQRNKSRTQRALEWLDTQKAKQKEQSESRKKIKEEKNKIQDETNTYVLSQLLEIDRLIKNGNTDEALTLVNHLLKLCNSKDIKPRLKKRINKRFLLLTEQQSINNHNN